MTCKDVLAGIGLAVLVTGLLPIWIAGVIMQAIF